MHGGKAKSNWGCRSCRLARKRAANSKIGFNCWGGELEALEAKKGSGWGKAATEHYQGSARLEAADLEPQGEEHVQSRASHAHL